MAVHNDLTWYKGTAGVQPFTITPVVNITGWTLLFTMRKQKSDPDPPVLQKTVAVADGPNGVFNLTLVRADTVNLSAGAYDYDIQRTDSGGEDVLTEGKFALLQEVRTP